METVVKAYDELTDRLSNLAKPVHGRVGVYRGQTTDFGAMLPSGLRRPGPSGRNAIWHYYAMAVSQELWSGSGTSPEENSVCIEAVAQHYGPGSPFLDVTRSVDTAVWFALHDRLAISAHHLMGKPGPPDEGEDLPVEETWWGYRPLTGTGYLYVFDVPEWTGIGSLPHGALLDLSSRPMLSKSSRIKIQKACLLGANPSIKGGDLQEFYACVPILVGWPMEGAPRLGDSTDLLFPDPSEDPWYRSFLSIPLTWVVDPESRVLKLARPLEIASYFYSSKTKREEITTHHAKFISPNPFYPAAEQSLSMNPSGSREFRFSEATRILFEAPIIHWFLRYTPDMWNQAILADDMSDEVDAFGHTPETPRILLTSVYMEFSPLENTDWGSLTGETDYSVQLLRALWLVRDGSRFGLYIFPQQIAVRGAKGYEAGPFLYTFVLDSGGFLGEGRGKSIVAQWQNAPDKAFWIALAILRLLSPVLKADPSPCQDSVEENGNRTMMIPIRGAVARLLPVKEARNGRLWFVPRDSSTGAPFFPGSIREHVEIIRLESPVPWPQADAAYIRQMIHERFKDGRSE